MHPAGRRAYSCGPTCGHRDLYAEPVEQDLLLKALVRAAFALKHPALVSPEEARRWGAVNPLDPHAMLAAGFVHVDVDHTGRCRPAWRHESDRSRSGLARISRRGSSA